MFVSYLTGIPSGGNWSPEGKVYLPDWLVFPSSSPCFSTKSRKDFVRCDHCPGGLWVRFWFHDLSPSAPDGGGSLFQTPGSVEEPLLLFGYKHLGEVRFQVLHDQHSGALKAPPGLGANPKRTGVPAPIWPVVQHLVKPFYRRLNRFNHVFSLGRMNQSAHSHTLSGPPDTRMQDKHTETHDPRCKYSTDDHTA